MDATTDPAALDAKTILAVHEFGRARLLGTLDAIEEAIAKNGGNVADVLAWRPGPGRAHVAWQAMHCAATHDRYLHVALLGVPVADAMLVERYAGGSTPSDGNVPTLADIRATLATHYAALRSFIEGAAPADLAKTQTLPNGSTRSFGEALILLAWHEAHHQGQIHLTWNMYRAAHSL